jgi:nucleoside-diphosphate-sugar epimerase
MLLGANQCERRPAFINAGSYWQFDSDGSFAPNSLYAATKQAFEDILKYYQQRHHIPAVTLVLYDTFGQDDVRPKLWQHVIASSKGTELSLSPGEQMIHLVHIDDVVDAFILAASCVSDGTLTSLRYTVHSSHPRRLRDVIERLDAEADLQLRLHWGGIPYPAMQIMTPYVGEPLPRWSDRIDVAAALVQAALLRKNTAATFSREGRES